MKSEVDQITIGKESFYATLEFLIIRYILNPLWSSHVGFMHISNDLLVGDWCKGRKIFGQSTSEFGEGIGYAHVQDEFFRDLTCDDLLPTPGVQRTSHSSILVYKPNLYRLIQAPYIPICANVPDFWLTFLEFSNNAITVLCGYEFLPQLSLDSYQILTISSIFHHIILGVHFGATLEHMRLFNVYVNPYVFIE